MKRSQHAALSLAREFAPVLAFYLGNSLWGAKAGIAVSLAVTLLSIVWLVINREKPTSYFVFSVLLSLLSAALDLTSQTSFVFMYEAVAINVFFGFFFLRSCFRGTPVIT